jgi:diguanylate cyclase (GGDEF)-like protein/PAS domain S-box-containing protein
MPNSSGDLPSLGHEGRSSDVVGVPGPAAGPETTKRAGPPEVAGLSQEMRDAVLDNLSDGVYFVDRRRRILYWNRGAEHISGFSAAEVVGRRCGDNLLNHCDEAGTSLCGDERCPLLATMLDGHQREVHIYLHHKNGERRPVCVRSAPLHDSSGAVVGAVETFHDDSALVNSRRRASDWERVSMSDPLTGVGNRRMGEVVLAGWIDQYRTAQRPFGLLLADVDSFKHVNDRFGHEVGDDALCAVAGTLAHTSRHGDEIVRWGGDEFLVLLAGADASTLSSVGERARALVKQTRLLAESERVPLSVSVGGTLALPNDTPELIVRRADTLMYRSKLAGRDRTTLDIDTYH